MDKCTIDKDNTSTIIIVKKSINNQCFIRFQMENKKIGRFPNNTVCFYYNSQGFFS